MAIIVYTTKPENLLASIYKEIKDKRIDTWDIDPDGDFTHTPASGQFAGRAWLSPVVEDNSLVFRILRPKNKNITTGLYGIYHGRFAEMLLNHFDSEFTNLTLTALAVPLLGDNVS